MNRRLVEVSFRVRAVEVHPDRGGTDEGMRHLIEAKDVLLRHFR